jgi:hypothetical protein
MEKPLHLRFEFHRAQRKWAFPHQGQTGIIGKQAIVCIPVYQPVRSIGAHP